MAYNKFTIDAVRKSFGVEILGNKLLFEHVKPIPPTEVLREFLKRYLPLGSAIGTEKARSEFIIALVGMFARTRSCV